MIFWYHLGRVRLLIYEATKSKILSVVLFSLLAHPVGLCIVLFEYFMTTFLFIFYLGELKTIGKV